MLDTGEGALQVNGNNVVPFLLCHVEDHAVSQDTGDTDQDVDLAKVVDAGLDDVLATFHGGDGVIAGHGVSASCLDFVHYFVSRALVTAGAVQGCSEVGDDDTSAVGGEGLGNAPTDAPAGAGYDRCFSF